MDYTFSANCRVTVCTGTVPKVLHKYRLVHQAVQQKSNKHQPAAKWCNDNPFRKSLADFTVQLLCPRCQTNKYFVILVRSTLYPRNCH